MNLYGRFGLIVVALVSLTACGGGGGSSAPANNPQTFLSSGNWSIVATSTAAPGTVSHIGGSLVQTGNSVSGVMHIANSSCYSLLTNVPFSGTVTGNTVNLTSASVNSQVITVSASGSGVSLAGTYSIAGGCAAGDRGNVTGVSVPSVSGTWKASLASGSTVVTMTGTITQAPTATADGLYPLSGSFTFSGSPCSSGGTLSSTNNDSFVAGDLFWITASTHDNDGGTGVVWFDGFVNNPANPTAMSGTYQVRSGLCVGETANLTFTKQ